MGNIPGIFWLVPAAAILALGFAYYFFTAMKRESEGTKQGSPDI